MSARLTQAVSAWLWVCGLVLAPCAAAHAQDYGARAQVARPLATTNREDATAAGTEIDTTQRTAAYETIDDVLLEGPGTHALRTGWIGSFTSASLRGAEAEHTAVLLGDIPISSADAAAFDLSTLPVELFDRITLFRGGAPTWLGQNAIGGVVQLVPRSARGSSLSATGVAGSFSTYGLSLASAVVPDGDGPKLLASAGVLSTQGDFVYHDDNRTAFDTSDDRDVRRRNADMLQGHGLMHGSLKLGPGNLDVLGLGFERVGGEPGAPANPALQARRDVGRGLGAASYTLEKLDGHGERVLRLQALAALGLTRERFTDLYGEVGNALPKQPDQSTSDAFARVAASAAATPFLELTLVGSARSETRDTSDPYARIPLPDSTRTSFAASAETNFHGRIAEHRVELRPSIHVDHQQAVLNSEHFGMLVKTGANDTLPTYRIGLGVEVFSDLTLNASYATGVLTPSMSELFGDGAFILGNTSLLPERSQSYEVGLVDVTCMRDFSGTFEARVFDLSIDDQVIFERNSFAQLFAINLRSSHVQGVELGAHTSYTKHFLFAAAATFLDTEGKPGKRLPNRPRAVVYASPTVSTSAVGPFDALRFFVSGSYASASFDDPDNATPLKPSQLFFDAGSALAFAHERAELRITASDVLDRGGYDLRHFPLPGRTVMASFTYKEDTQ